MPILGLQVQVYLLKATEVSPSFNKVAWDNLHLLEAMSRQPAGGAAGQAPPRLAVQ